MRHCVNTLQRLDRMIMALEVRGDRGYHAPVIGSDGLAYE
jgi:hypothetical protein